MLDLQSGKREGMEQSQDSMQHMLNGLFEFSVRDYCKLILCIPGTKLSERSRFQATGFRTTKCECVANQEF